jgi:polar amino acid transport system substrate-binding protein
MRFLACLIAGLVLAGSCRAGAETVRIAAEDDWPPYSSAVTTGEQGAQPQGFAVDLVREVFASQGIRVEFVTVPFSRCLAYTLNGSVAGCFNVGKTPSNQDDFIWTPTPLLVEDLGVFARVDAHVQGEISLADLRHHAVGYTVGYTYATELMTDPHVTRYGASSDQQLLRMLMARRVDYILLNRLPGELRINANSAFRGKVKFVGKLSTDNFWLAFSKSHPDGRRLSQVFERGLSDFKRDGRYRSMMQAFRRSQGLP